MDTTFRSSVKMSTSVLNDYVVVIARKRAKIPRTVFKIFPDAELHQHTLRHPNNTNENKLIYDYKMSVFKS